MTTKLDGPVDETARTHRVNGTPAAFDKDVFTPGESREFGGRHGDVTVTSAATAPSAAGRKWLAVARIAIGGVFLWPFLDKLFGLGYSTKASGAWLQGGSPTKGFLSHVDVGPGASFFQSIAGTWWADWLFMLGLGGVGVAVILGVGLRISAIAGSVLMMMMWLAEWPLARFTNGGDPTGSTNPILDYHLLYALVLVAVAVTAAGTVWGFGKKWASLPLVQRNPWLK
ncbi:MAG: hypothetical protein ABI382_12505 [Nakamurella sp.]